jgi:hypothetical protein
MKCLLCCNRDTFPQNDGHVSVINNRPLAGHKGAKIGRFSISITNQNVDLPERVVMSVPSRSEYRGPFFNELGDGVRSSASFDQDVVAKIGRCIAVRRNLCGLSQQQLGARLGICPAEVDAYEQGAKRMNSKLLLQTAQQLSARPRFFFQ